MDHALAQGILLLSETTLTELTQVLGRAKFDPYLSPGDRQRFIELLGGVARIVPILHHVQACRDARDDKFLDLALAGGAAAIITGDNDLLELDPFHGIPIISPATFLEWQ